MRSPPVPSGACFHKRDIERPREAPWGACAAASRAAKISYRYAMKQTGIRIISLRGWAAIAVGLGLLAVGTFLAIGIFIFLLPLMLVVPLLYWLLPKPKLYRATAVDQTIIEGEFNVVDPKGENRKALSGDNRD